MFVERRGGHRMDKEDYAELWVQVKLAVVCRRIILRASSGTSNNSCELFVHYTTKISYEQKTAKCMTLN